MIMFVAMVKKGPVLLVLRLIFQVVGFNGGFVQVSVTIRGPAIAARFEGAGGTPAASRR
jgi:hypothetical protein